jgi:hypothetical protein
MFFFSGPMLLKNPVFLQAFSREQLNALSYLFIRIYSYGASLFMVFYGSASLIRGYLIYRSGYLPRLLGVLVGLVGVGFILRNFTLVLAPTYSSGLLLLPAPITILALTLWFLIKGVDVQKWEARVTAMRAPAPPSFA